MKVREWLLLGVLGWSAIGAAGVLIRWRLQERAVARRHALWLVAVWLVYGAALLGTSRLQRQRVVAIGEDQCFEEMCFRVEAVEALPGWVRGRSDHIVRLRIRISNHGRKPESEGLLKAYLIDAQGRRWDPLRGLSGNPLNERVPGGVDVVSEPVFQVSEDATDLKLVLTHGFWQPGTLIIGDSDSLGHRRTVVPLMKQLLAVRP